MGSNALSQFRGLSQKSAPLHELRQAAYAAIWSITESEESVTPNLAYSLLARFEEFDAGILSENDLRRAIVSDLEVFDRQIERRSPDEIWRFVFSDVERFLRGEIVFNDLFDRAEAAAKPLTSQHAWADPKIESLLRVLQRAVDDQLFRFRLDSELQRWLQLARSEFMLVHSE